MKTTNYQMNYVLEAKMQIRFQWTIQIKIRTYDRNQRITWN